MNQPTKKSDLVATGTFSIFSNLPREVRLMIWEFAAAGRRIVEIRQRPLKKTVKEWKLENRGKDVRGFGGDCKHNRGHDGLPYSFQNNLLFWGRSLLFGIESACPAPGLLFTCHEARKVASQYYKPVFQSLGAIQQTYFDFDLDILYIRWDQYDEGWSSALGLGYVAELLDGLYPILDKENLKRVKRLAVLSDALKDDEWGFRSKGLTVGGRISFRLPITRLLRTFGGVEELILVTNHYSDKECNNDLYLMEESIDIESTMAAFSAYHPTPGEDNPMPRFCRLPEPGLDIDELRLELEHFSQTSETPFPFPRIETRIVLEPGWKDSFERAKASCRLLFEKNQATVKRLS